MTEADMVPIKARKAYLNKLKITKGCVDCGYNEHPAALDFDHVDPATKLFNISQHYKSRWSEVLDEIEKCVIRCANCHRIRSREQSRGRLNYKTGHVALGKAPVYEPPGFGPLYT